MSDCPGPARSPLWFRPSQIAPETRVFAMCRRCLTSRDLVVADLPDIPFSEIEPRLRCTDRGRDGKGPVCGSRATVEFYCPPVKDEKGLLTYPGPIGR